MTEKLSERAMAERRQWPRMALDAAAIIRLETLQSDIKTRIINASANGLLLAMPAVRPVGTRMHVRVKIGDPVEDISVSGIIVHVTQTKNAAPGFTARVGVYLTHVTPQWQSLCERLARP
jgi:PilZ domain